MPIAEDNVLLTRTGPGGRSMALFAVAAQKIWAVVAALLDQLLVEK